MQSASRSPRAAAGAVLIEALVAVAIIGIALLFVVGLLAHEARLTARAAAQHEAFMLLEAALEGIRAGALPREDAVYSDPLPPWLPIPAAREALLRIEMGPVDPPVRDLWQVTATVHYRAGRDVLRRSVTTRMWLR